MARERINGFPRDATTIVTNKTLLDRPKAHLNKTGENQTSFMTRALLNQLEKEGDLDIRDVLIAENEEF